MRHKYEPREQQEQAKPREARPSGATRIYPDADVPREDEQTLRLSLPSARSNARLAILPSILVDASYQQVVSSFRAHLRSTRRRKARVAACAFLCGVLAVPLGAKVARELAPPSPPLRMVNVGVSAPAPQQPASVLPAALPPQKAPMDQREAARRVYRAEHARQAGRLQDARPLLTDVLQDRPGYPPALAALAELELDAGRVVAAVRSARLAVRSLPKSVENWELLSKACAAAGLHAESSRARARAAQLTRMRQGARTQQ